jgi:hypothetical protein
VVTDPLGTGDAVGVAELLGLADGMTDGDRDGEGDREGDADREGLGTDRVGPASELCCTLDWPVSADCCGCGGRTRKYSARMARNRPERIAVDFRGRPLTRHPRWHGRCRGRRRR